MTVQPAGTHGFTLLELLVALSVFALLSVMAYAGLSVVLDQRAATEHEAERLAALQLAVTRIETDIEQITDRPIRDEFEAVQPALVGDNAFTGRLLEFTRGGRRNPFGRARSSLQRVAYTIKEQRLVRITWPVLDRTANTPFSEEILIEPVDRVAVQYLDEQNQWHTEWPPRGTGYTAPAGPPRALRIELDVPDFGRVTRVLRVAS